ncbi:hypothetical protein [Arthrobacter sp. StoSoilB5]|nr:hypothetical protein [Arthrobacter sp. StoSoilB5]BCW46638.1 hypothetical protein StoSoilB5_38220 [Arthrobacter sp. StoSoilB5]
MRTAYNTEVVAQAGLGLFIADAATAVNGIASGGQVQMGGTV